MYTHSPNQTTQLVLWHITEPESFFTQIVTAGKNITHPHKRLQHLCGRFLLRYIVPDFPVANVITEQYNKPFLSGHPYLFSISHCDDYAAAIVSMDRQVGIDVETIAERVLKIRVKFLTASEEAILVNDCPNMSNQQRLTLAWSAKETLFKQLGETGVDFKQHLVLRQVQAQIGHGLIVADVNRNTIHSVTIHYRFFNNVVLTWSFI